MYKILEKKKSCPQKILKLKLGIFLYFNFDGISFLFFVQVKHLKSTFKFGKNLKIQPSPPLLKKYNYLIADFLIFSPDPSHTFWTFSTFCDIFIRQDEVALL